MFNLLLKQSFFFQYASPTKMAPTKIAMMGSTTFTITPFFEKSGSSPTDE